MAVWRSNVAISMNTSTGTPATPHVNYIKTQPWRFLSVSLRGLFTFGLKPTPVKNASSGSIAAGIISLLLINLYGYR
eukprot:scaffold200865_cov18-Tisochrysis_lutea.AAC.1